MRGAQSETSRSEKSRKKEGKDVAAAENFGRKNTFWEKLLTGLMTVLYNIYIPEFRKEPEGREEI